MHKLIESFTEFQFEPTILAALEALNFTKPTPIQQQTIPLLLEGKDVLGLAQTGTGKTAAFVLPLLQQLATSSKKGQSPRALIITPTRELALQVEQHIKDLTKNMFKIETLALCGGQSYIPQIKQLKKGCSIIVGTPGRIIDHIQRGTLNLSAVEYFVLDEADEMLRMGFVEDVENIMENIPEQRQTALFSATMPPRVRQLVNRYLRDPEVVEIKAEEQLMPKIQQLFLFAQPSQKTDALIKLLAIAEEGSKIVFVRTKQQTEEVAEALVRTGIRAIALNGDLAQAMRERLVQQFRRGSADVLVATDIAARGLDVSQVTLVINYDMPGDPETYVHRIGRTGRAGRTGQSILFVEPKQARLLNMIERHTQQKIQKMQVPTDGFIRMRQQEQFLSTIKANMQEKVSPDFHQALQKLVEEEGYEWQDLAAMFAKMQLKEDHWVTTAESPFDVSQTRERERDFGGRREREFGNRRPREREFGGRRERGFSRDRDQEGARDRGFSRDRDQESGRGRRGPSAEQVLYRISVGRNHGVRPGQIIGALANEGGISGAQINGLKIFDEHATVYLPGGLSKNVVESLKKAWVCGRQLHLKTQADLV